MTTRTSSFIAASWATRLAVGIALAIGLVFAALVANAAPLTVTGSVAGFRMLSPL